MVPFRDVKADILDRGGSKFQKEASRINETLKQYTTPTLAIFESPWGPWGALKGPLGWILGKLGVFEGALGAPKLRFRRYEMRFRK